MALSPMSTSFTAQPDGGAFGINAYGPDFIEVNGTRFHTSLLLHSDSGPTAFDGLSVDGLLASHLEMVASQTPEVVLLGTGSRQKFVSPAVIAPLAARQAAAREAEARKAAATKVEFLAMQTTR